MKTHHGPTILTYSGKYFDFTDPMGSDYNILDIAAGLSKICRFNGQCHKFYSVAEHSVHVSRIVPKELALVGLLHDAAEAFMGDMVKPLKSIMPEFQRVETEVEKDIFRRFGLPHSIPKEIKDADVAMLACEQRKLMNNQEEWRWTKDVTPADVKLELWNPALAQEEFMLRFREIVGREVGRF
jgi:uncharacterized protein